MQLTDVTQALSRGQPRRPARARDPRAADRSRLLARGVHLSRRARRRASPASRACCCGSASSASSATRSTSRAATASTSGTRCSRPAPTTGSGRSGSSRSGSCACRSSTSSSARTPTRSRRRTAPAMPWAVKLDKEEDFIGKWALERVAERPGRDGARRLHARRTARVPTEGAVVLDERGDAGRPGHQRAPLAPARRVIGMAWVPAALATTARRSRSPTTARRLAGSSRPSRSTTRRARCSARDALAFLTPVDRESGAPASPMERPRPPAGAGSSSVTAGTSPSATTSARSDCVRETVGFADRSHLPKLELHGTDVRAREPASRSGATAPGGAR